MSVLPGEPLDGSGRICIHLFVRDVAGSYTEPHVLHQKTVGGKPVPGELVARPTRGRLACDRRRVPARGPQVIARTDDPRAVTCPRCLASPECRELMAKLEAPATAT